MIRPGEKIGEWVVVRTLGEGGMGAVYLCHSAISERILAAVKVMKPHDVGDSKKRFVRELELLAALRHPAIVQVFGGGHDEQRDLLWMAMEYLEGEELKDRLRRGPLPWVEAVRYFAQLGDGLRFAHEQGVVHRDIKPQNILITKNGDAKLLDFGIAMSSGATQLTRQGTVPGTIAYMPPEVFEGEKPDHRADIYALGLCLWEALTGREAYPEEGGTTPQQAMVQVMGKKLTSEAFELENSYPDALRELVRRCTQPEPDVRLGEMTEFVDLIGRTDEVVIPKALARPAPPPTKPRTRWGLVAGGAGVLAILGAAVVVLVVLVGVAVAVPLLTRTPAPAPPVVQSPPAPREPGPSPNRAHDKVLAKLPVTLQNGAVVTTASTVMSGKNRVISVIYSIELQPDEILGFYREQLPAKGFKITSDNKPDADYGTWLLSSMKTYDEAINIQVDHAQHSPKSTVTISGIIPGP